MPCNFAINMEENASCFNLFPHTLQGDTSGHGKGFADIKVGSSDYQLGYWEAILIATGYGDSKVSIFAVLVLG